MSNKESEIQFSVRDAQRIGKAAEMMKAISHPVRLAILGHLSDGNEYGVTELQFLLHIEQSTVSHHLGIMRDKQIVISRRDGKNIFYKLKNNNLKKLVECINMCACIDE